VINEKERFGVGPNELIEIFLYEKARAAISENGVELTLPGT
jgi:hypothetical protein